MFEGRSFSRPAASRVWPLALLCILFATGCSGQQPSGLEKQTNATWEYWQRLKQINDRFGRSDSDDSPKTIADPEASQKAFLKAIEGARKELSDLSVKDVDREVVDLGSQFLELYGEQAISVSKSMAATNQQSIAKMTLAISQMEEVQRHSNTLKADANHLRAKLTRRYGREFSPIDW